MRLDCSDDDDDGDGEWTGLKLPVLKLLAVIVSPTRELAAQIHGVLALFADALPPGLARQLLIGGKASRTPAEDRAALRKEGAHILVGTPGRINQVLETLPGLDTSELEVLALDEADRLLAMGSCVVQGVFLFLFFVFFVLLPFFVGWWFRLIFFCCC
jgi:superfamily II DNA/RNA helicase